jgi:hypothetical protein
MNLNKASKRDNKRNKRRNGMQISGKSIFVIQETLIKKGNKKNKQISKDEESNA